MLEACHQLTRLLAKSCGPVRVNCVAPGLIETRITAGSDTLPAAWEYVRLEKSLGIT